MIVERILEAKKRKMKQWPVRSNRASEMGHPCTKYLVLNRTRWQEKTLPDASLQLIFDIGNMIEELVMKDLREAGIRVIEQQRTFEWAKYQITGAIDAKIQPNGDNAVYPLEVKSASPFVFNAVNSIGDMLNSKYAYMKKYPAQMMLYLLMDNKERGLFLFKNKSTGALKEIWIDLDYAMGEELLKKAETVNDCISWDTVPEPMEWDDAVCPDCSFLHICTPDRIGKEIEMSDDADLIELLTKYEELKGPAKEFEKVDEALKEKLKGKEKLLVGDFLIEGKWTKRTVYEIPDDVKTPYAKEIPSWRKKIIKL